MARVSKGTLGGNITSDFSIQGTDSAKRSASLRFSSNSPTSTHPTDSLWLKEHLLSTDISDAQRQVFFF